MRRERLKVVDVKVPLTLNGVEQYIIFDNSVERVINSAIRVAQHLLANDPPNHPDASYMRELADINLQDLEELKNTIVKLWNATRNELFIYYNPTKEDKP